MMMRSFGWAALLACLLPLAAAAQQGAQITPNYKDADLGQVIEAVSQVTGKSFIVDPRVRAQVTMLSTSPMSRRLMKPLASSSTAYRRPHPSSRSADATARGARQRPSGPGSSPRRDRDAGGRGGNVSAAAGADQAMMPQSAHLAPIPAPTC
jgi:fructose-specific component phosphotransferase system IIB-like protein